MGTRRTLPLALPLALALTLTLTLTLALTLTLTLTLIPHPHQVGAVAAAQPTWLLTGLWIFVSHAVSGILHVQVTLPPAHHLDLA